MRPLVLGMALLGATLCVAVTADAGKAPVTLGRVTTRVQKGPEVRQALESAVTQELSKVVSSVKSRERYVLSAALVKMETVTESDQAETTCVVSATLTREGGALHAVLQGRARATDHKRAARDAELGALRAAVRSAIGRVPEALR